VNRGQFARDSGSVTLESVLVIPLLVLTLLAVIQVALVAYSGHVAGFAAREGARAFRLTGDAEDGRAQARDFLRHLGAVTVLEPSITASRIGDDAVVDVIGHAPALLPGFHLTVAGHSRGPLERFAAGARP